MNLRDIPRNRLDSLDRHLRAAEAAISRIEILVAIGVLIRFRHFALAFVLGRSANVHAQSYPFRYPADLTSARVAIRRKKADVGEQNIAREVPAFEEQARRDPTLAAGPACNRRRSEKLLSQRSRGLIEIRNPGKTLQPKLSIRRDRELHRTFDLGTHGSGTIKIARQENLLEQRSDLVMILTQHGAQLRLKLGRQILA